MIRWQVTTRHPTLGAFDDQPPGWEPFAVSEGKIWLRRRLDNEPARIAPATGYVLSATEVAARQRTSVAMQQARAREGLAP